jgi:NAD(P)H-hydrate repair Nnr-like enzyme with NAD(P)H-hydrate epimerase domain
MRDDKRKLQVHEGTGNGSGDAYQCNSVLRWTHAKATIVKSSTGNDQKYNEANLMLPNIVLWKGDAFLD